MSEKTLFQHCVEWYQESFSVNILEESDSNKQDLYENYVNWAFSEFGE